MTKILNFIDGRFVEPVDGNYLDNIEPATGEPYSQVADSDARDVELAVAAAEKAFPDWSRTPAADRSLLLLRIADLIERDLEKFARAESIDTGKPLSLARSLDIPRAVSNFRFFATAILHTENEAHITDGVAFNYTLRQPRGIVGLISPWNLPLYLLSWKIAPAIACGNTAIAKPSELTPMTAHLLGETCIEAGLPNGVLNIVQGTGPNVGAAPEDRHDLLHRWHRDRPQSRRSCCPIIQESLARTGRKESKHRLRRCRSRRRYRRQRPFLLR
jgi:aminomuconate-semialdehyde/2-hydroxymuconate-6-semialdehyde dehydrogenase